MGFRLYVENGYGEEYCFGKNLGYTEKEKGWMFLLFLATYHYWECLEEFTDDKNPYTSVEEIYEIMVDVPTYAHYCEFTMTWKEFSCFMQVLEKDLIANEGKTPYWLTDEEIKHYKKFMSCTHDFKLKWW